MTTRVQDRPTALEPAIRPAEVVAVDGDGLYTVRCLDGAAGPACWATHALAGQPACAPGSRVLVAFAGGDAGYVIGTLDPPPTPGVVCAGTASARVADADGRERLVLSDPARALTISYDARNGALWVSPSTSANLILAAPDGDVELRAGKRLRLRGAAGTDLATRRLTVSAGRTVAALGEAMVDADALTATLRRVRQISERVEVTATRIVERAGTVLRRATGLYRQDATRLRLSGEDSCHLRGGRVDVRAAGDARVDGEKIRLG
jgi:hypothetical protein